MSTIRRTRSLRGRLFVLLVVPLVFIALASSIVRYRTAQDMSQDLYDDTLKVVAHAVAREVVLTKGNLVDDALLNSLVGALGDPIYYQVKAGDGRFITGHSVAPVPSGSIDVPAGAPVFFNSHYNGHPVRVVILREFIVDIDFDGWTTVQVWQTVSQRQALSLTLVGQSVVNLLLIVGSATVLFWFGINRGLAPLTDLRAAVALRSASDLGPIRRPVPREVAPLLETINNLFARLREELDRRNTFIGNAAHQLRNPVAAIQAQTEAALATTNEAERVERIKDLSLAARQLSRMSHQLLNFDIANESSGYDLQSPVDLSEIVADVARRHVPRALRANVEVELDAAGDALPVVGNRIMLEEAIDNLIDNGIKYGCAGGGRLLLTLRREGNMAVLTVADDGPGIPSDAVETVFDRFVRLCETDGDGCGLGLSIVRAIAERAGGEVGLAAVERGCTFRLALPVALGHREPSEPSHARVAAE